MIKREGLAAASTSPRASSAAVPPGLRSHQVVVAGLRALLGIVVPGVVCAG